MSRLEMTLTGGGTAWLISLDGDRIQLIATRAAAPGSRLSAALTDGRQVRVKIHRSVRVGDEFTLAGRLIDATRELRAYLQRHAAAADAP